MLQNREWILEDEATSTQLFNMGLSSSDAPSSLDNAPSLNIIKKVLGNFFSISDGADSASPILEQ